MIENMLAEQQIAKPTEKELSAFTYSVYDFISRHMCGKSLDEILNMEHQPKKGVTR